MRGFLTASLVFIACSTACGQGLSITADNIDELPSVVDDLIKHMDYEGLAALTERLGENGLRNASGWPYRAEVYERLGEHLKHIDLDYRIPILNGFRALSYQQQERTEVAVHFANVMIDEAWTQRGTGFAQDVSGSELEQFRSWIQRTQRFLADAAQRGLKDPQLTVCAITCLMTMAPERTGLDAILRDGIVQDPAYLPMYYQAGLAVLHRWTLNYDELKPIALFLAQETPQYGDALYFYVATPALYADGPELCLYGYGLDPKRLVQGYRDYVAHFGDDSELLQYAIKVACTAGLADDARDLFASLPEGEANIDVWNPALMETWRRWASDGGPAPKKGPLHDAAQIGDVAAFEKALQDGADINGVSPAGASALSMALAGGHRMIVEACLSHDADPNIFFPWDGAPLYLACEAKDVALVKDLLERGADPNLHRPSYGVPLHAAVSHSDNLCLTALLAAKDVEVDAVSPGGYTPLARAVSADRPDLIVPLLDAGADPNRPNKTYTTPLLAAAFQGPLETFLLLMEHGGEHGTTTLYLRTALHLAAAGNQPEIVAYLMAQGVDPNPVDAYGFTPLITAANAGHAEVLRMLLEAPAVRVNAQSITGATALHHAAENNRSEVAALLLQHGADPAIGNNANLTAQDLALQKGHADLAKRLAAAPRP